MELDALYEGVGGQSYQQMLTECQPATGEAYAEAWWEAIKPILCTQYADQPEVLEKLLRDREEVNARR